MSVAGDARERRAWLALGLALVTLIAVIDAVLGTRAVLIELVIIGPLAAGIRLTGRLTAVVAVYALAAAVLLGVTDRIFGTQEHLIDLLIVVLASGLAVVAARLRSRREAAARLLAAQLAVTASLAEAPAGPGFGPGLLAGIGRALGWPMGGLWRVDADSGCLRCLEVWHPGRPDLEPFARRSLELELAPGTGLPGRAWQARAPVWVSDSATDEGLPRSAAAAQAGLHAAFAFPIVSQDRVLGVVEFFTEEASRTDAALLGIMAGLGRQIGASYDRLRAQEAVRSSEARKTAMLESALDCVVTMDAEGKVVEFNPAAEQTFGYRREEAVGQPLADLIIPPALRQRHWEGLEHYLKTGEGPILGGRHELTALRADGSEFPVELTITRIALEGRPLFTGFVRDITERRAADDERMRLLELEREARVRAERAERRSAMLAEAAAVLSTSLDLETTLRNVARVAVPRLADWCLIDLIGEDGTLRRHTIAHADPERERAGWVVEERLPVGGEAAAGAGRVVRSGQPELRAELSAAAAADERERALIEAFDARSAITVPLRARGRVLGAVTLVSSVPERSYGNEDLALAEDLAVRCALAVDNARVYSERDYIARILQQHLLPPHLPDIPGLELATRYRAAGEATEVGGDFYDIFESGFDTWAVVIGDVRGKGAAAAAITGLARWTLRAAAMQEHDPVRILRTLNEAMLRQDEEEDRFCTVVYARMRPHADGGRSVCLACGGHPLPMILRADGRVEAAGQPGMLIGVDPDPVLAAREVVLLPGDALVLYTDGVPEARHEGRLFGQGRLRDLVASCRGQSAQAIAARIDEAANAFSEGRLRDDIAVVVCRVEPVTASVTRLGAGDRPEPATTS